MVFGQALDSLATTYSFDCFDRTTSALVARSTIDMTSLDVSCLPVPGATHDDSFLEADVTDALDTDSNYEELFFEEDEMIADDSFFDEENIDSHNDEAIGDTVGEHLGNLLGDLISDIFR